MVYAYSAQDANNQTYEIAAGTPFATYWLDGEPQEVNHPWTALDVYSDADLARFGIIKTMIPDPPPPRQEIRKSVVMTRLNDIGKLSAAFSALQANPLDFGKWFSPDWPNVYADDADLLALLNGIGLTADQIAQVTA